MPQLDQALRETFDSIFPAIPFAALLSVIFLLGWSDLRDVLARQRRRPSRHDAQTRLLGAGVISVLFLAMRFSDLGESVFASSVAIVLTFYGTALVMIPLTRKILLPYAATYALGISAPTLLEASVRESLAQLRFARVILCGH